MTIPLRPHWIANDSYREKCKMLVLNRSKGEIHKVDFSKLTDYIKEGDVICFNDSTINRNVVQQKNTNKMCRGSDYQRRILRGSTSYSGYH
nr:S-adenosylmethionine:tRNA ribosyltransferase-isomerase [Salmonella enterica]